MSAIAAVNHEDADRLLIEMVRERPHLYDPSWKDYKVSNETCSSWHDIGKVLGCDWKEAKDRWRKLRDSYVKQRKSLARRQQRYPNNGSSGNESPTQGKEQSFKPKWRYFEDMEFLAAHVRHRRSDTPAAAIDYSYTGYRTSENSLYYIKQASPPPDDDENEKFTEERPYDCVMPSENSNDVLADDPTERDICARKYMESILSQRIPKLPKKTEPQIPRVDHQPISEDAEIIIEPPNPEKEEKDEEALFGMMVSAAIRKFPPRLRSLAKMRINTIIYEIEEHQFQVAMDDIHVQGKNKQK